MIKLIFLSGENKILEFYLDENDKNNIKNYNVFNCELTRIIFKIKNPNIISTDFLLNWFRDYMGGNYNLEDYINHISKNGFYSPYFNSLNIQVEK